MKLQGWEAWLHARVVQERAVEMRLLVRSRYLQALNSLIGAIGQLMIPALTFAYFVLVRTRGGTQTLPISRRPG